MQDGMPNVLVLLVLGLKRLNGSLKRWRIMRGLRKRMTMLAMVVGVSLRMIIIERRGLNLTVG
jgi:hypothetical protein